ncbi:MAG: TrkA family potassium uptake protein [Clostridia bacterium]|nr:TrkA family potassium uptake protein [Clostridia bacterium]
MKSFVVIGLGRFGTAIARELSLLGHEVIAIDRDETKVNDIADEVTHAMAADIQDEGVLRRLGVTECDCAVVAFASSLQDNILVTLLLKELGVKRVIAKARSEMHVRVLKKVGADQIVFPEEDMGIRLARILDSGRVLDYVDIGGQYRVAEIRSPEDWHGKSLQALDLRRRHRLNVLLVKTQNGNGQLVNPSAEYIVKADDIIVVMGLDQDVSEVSDEE